MAKIKIRENLKGSKRKTVTYKGNPIRSPANFSAKTMQARKEWKDIFKVLKGKILQPRLFYWQSYNLELNEREIVLQKIKC